METKEVIAAMLKENTGTHFLDSGGDSGRHWQRNQVREFDAEPQVDLNFSADHSEIEFTLNVYHFLCENLEYDEDMQARYEAWVKEHSSDSNAHLQDMRSFIADEDHGFEGIYGDGDPFVDYTYNEENALSQDVQYAYFTVDDGGERIEYLLVQIHGGADARGGFTAPKAFRCNDELSFFNYRRGGVAPEFTDKLEQLCLDDDSKPEFSEINWSTDDGGYSWYYQGACGSGAGKQLESYEFSDQEADRGQGKIYVDGDSNGYCPISGGKLCGGYY